MVSKGDRANQETIAALLDCLYCSWLRRDGVTYRHGQVRQSFVALI